MLSGKNDQYIMPHELDRYGQKDAYHAIMEWIKNSDKKYFILYVPTGVGKTGIIANTTLDYKVMAFVKTKVLQQSVYEDSYSFDKVMGKANYPCRYKPETHKADVCAMPKQWSKHEKKSYCQLSGKCAYHVALDKFLHSQRAVTNYSKFISDPTSRGNPEIYAFDEAHELMDMVIDQAGLQINLYKHPWVGNYFKDIVPHNINNDIQPKHGVEILRDVYKAALINAPKSDKPESQMSEREKMSLKRKEVRHSRFLEKVHKTAQLIMADDEREESIWHVSILSDGTLTLKPLTAAYHFEDILPTGDKKVILMSATISPEMMNYLGVDKDNFEFYEAPQQFPAMLRPLYDLGMKGMGTSNVKKNPSLPIIQAAEISGVLNTKPDSSAIILTSSKAKAFALGERLEIMGHDIFIPPLNVGTDRQLSAWEDYRKSGAVCISWNFWEGVSLDDDDICIIANIKYPDLSSPFEKARMLRDIRQFQYRAAIHTVQGAGRIQRGKLEHYESGKKIVVLADGNWRRIKSYAPGDFIERVVEWNEK